MQVSAARQLYEETCILLRDKAHHLKLREDLESKLSAGLANMDSELRKCVTADTPDGRVIYLHAVEEVFIEYISCTVIENMANSRFLLDFSPSKFAIIFQFKFDLIIPF